MSLPTSAARRGGIAARLVGVMVAVILVGGITAVGVAALVGPSILQRHLAQLEREPGTAFEHAALALRSATSVTLGVAVAASVLTSLVASLLLARRVAATLGSMSRAAAQVAAGQLDARITRPGVGAEFDALADSFNEMAGRLDDDETQRRRLMADVAHELRTPVATISATVEAVQDGVQDFSAGTVSVLRAQASRLSRLADDLSAVTRAESGALRLHLRPWAPSELLARAEAAGRKHFETAGVGLVVHAPPDLPLIAVDPDRIGQVLANLLEERTATHPARWTGAVGRRLGRAERPVDGERRRRGDRGGAPAARI